MFQSKPVNWVPAIPDHKATRTRARPFKGGDNGIKSPAEVKEAQHEKSGRPQESSIQELPAFATHSRIIKTDQREKDSVCIKDNTKTLKLLISAWRRAVVYREKHCKFLLERNQKLARDIEDTDIHSISCARERLIAHEKLKGSKAALGRWNDRQIRQEKTELKDAITGVDNQLSGLQAQLKGVEAGLVNAQTDLQTLKVYKDRLALKIAKINEVLDKLKEEQQDECDSLSVLCQYEMVSLERELHQKQQDMLSTITKQSESFIPPVVKMMAIHNHTMIKEIHMHKQDITELEEGNKELLRSIQELQLSKSEKFKLDKCLPDMDVHLSIPKEECLPI